MNTVHYASSGALLETLTTPDQDPVTAENLPGELVDFYRANGFVRVRGLVSRQRALEFGDAAANLARSGEDYHHSPIFQQLVNVWTHDETLRSLTLVRASGASPSDWPERICGSGTIRCLLKHLITARPPSSIKTNRTGRTRTL